MGISSCFPEPWAGDQPSTPLHSDSRPGTYLSAVVLQISVQSPAYLWTLKVGLYCHHILLRVSYIFHAIKGQGWIPVAHKETQTVRDDNVHMVYWRFLMRFVPIPTIASINVFHPRRNASVAEHSRKNLCTVWVFNTYYHFDICIFSSSADGAKIHTEVCGSGALTA